MVLKGHQNLQKKNVSTPLWTLINNMVYDILIVTLKIVCVICFTLYTSHDKNMSTESTLKLIYNFMGGQFLMSNLLNKPVSEFMRVYSLYIEHCYTWIVECIIPDPKHNSDFYKLWSRGLVDLSIFSDEIRNRLLVLIEVLKTIDDSRKPRLKVYMNLIYNLGLTQTNAGPSEAIADIIVKIDNLLCNYENKDIIIRNIVCPYVFNMYTKDTLDIVPFYLVGEPGTGKTKFVEDFVRITDSELIVYNQETLRCHEDSFYINDVGEVKDSYIKNEFIRSMITLKKKNFVLFIDEFDKVLRDINGDTATKLLDLLNGTTKTIKSKYLGLNIESPNILIIMAGNKKLCDLVFHDYSSVKPYIGPLENRILYIDFPHMSVDTKLMIVRNKLTDSGIVITEELLRNIDIMVKNDKNGGVRKLLCNTVLIINTIKSNTFFKSTTWSKYSSDIYVMPDDSLGPLQGQDPHSGH
jgi:hypothetical protein